MYLNGFYFYDKIQQNYRKTTLCKFDKIQYYIYIILLEIDIGLWNRVYCFN